MRAYATNSEGTSYGEEKSFTTSPYLPTVITYPVTQFTDCTAIFEGNIVSDGGAEVTSRGFCWSTTENPTINHNVIEDGSGQGGISADITDLMFSTTYYVRAYATNSEGTSYGEQMSFTTLSTGTINGYEWVDLGLPSKLRWATCNVGANYPEDYGSYLTFDEANDVTWGGSWRTPTKDELSELSSNCSWTWTTLNGINGCNVTGPNGNSIFLPAAGYRNGSSLYYVGSGGYYWSSTPYGSDYAYYLGFDSSGQNMYGYNRSRGQSVRLVAE